MMNNEKDNIFSAYFKYIKRCKHLFFLTVFFGISFYKGVAITQSQESAISCQIL